VPLAAPTAKQARSTLIRCYSVAMLVNSRVTT